MEEFITFNWKARYEYTRPFSILPLVSMHFFLYNNDLWMSFRIPMKSYPPCFPLHCQVLSLYTKRASHLEWKRRRKSHQTLFSVQLFHMMALIISQSDAQKVAHSLSFSPSSNHPIVIFRGCMSLSDVTIFSLKIWIYKMKVCVFKIPKNIVSYKE